MALIAVSGPIEGKTVKTAPSRIGPVIIPSIRSVHPLPVSNAPDRLSAHVSSKAVRVHNPNRLDVRQSKV